MRSKFAVLGHPIHPMLVAIPIGLFAWALVSDIVYVARDHDQMWYDIAFWSGIAAWVTALVAALPGLGDYLTMAVKSDAAQIATAHMVLNVVVVVLYVVAMLLMLDNNATTGGRLGGVIALHAVGTGILLLSGWLGGEMVFRHHLAMIPDDAELESAERVRHDVAGTARGRKPAGEHR
jgi:uncharacterized membrane protein